MNVWFIDCMQSMLTVDKISLIMIKGPKLYTFDSLITVWFHLFLLRGYKHQHYDLILSDFSFNQIIKCVLKFLVLKVFKENLKRYTSVNEILIFQSFTSISTFDIHGTSRVGLTDSKQKTFETAIGYRFRRSDPLYDINFALSLCTANRNKPHGQYRITLSD